MRVLILLLLAGTAHAAPVCYPWEDTSAALEATTQPANPVVWISATKTDASFVLTWFCDTKYKWQQVGFWGWKKNLRPDWIDTLRAVYSMDRAQLEALWTASIKCEAGTEAACGDYAALRPIALRQWAATRPEPIAWTVRTNGTNSSRPVFRVNSNGTRNTTAVSGERVKVGEPCKCTLQAIEEPVSGSDAVNSWCRVDGADNVATTSADALGERVSWCVRQ